VKKDFLSIADLTLSDIQDLFATAASLKAKFRNKEIYQPLKGKTMAMIFQKPSARTRISFETGMFWLGGHAIYLAPNDVGIGSRETPADIARVLSRYNNCIMARLFGHELIVELAKHASIPVINGLTDLLHPCQILADAFTILEHRKKLEGIRVAYIGDGNNVTNSWLNFASIFPIELSLGIPGNYMPDPTILKNAKDKAGNRLKVTHDPKEAVANCDVIYTDVWASMGKEDESIKRKIVFKNYQVNDDLVKLAKPDVLVMHCLPAHRGEEITDSVLEGPHSIVFDEAENRLHVQNAILVKLLT
jgi:ornithine carbamoyltransferase